MRINSFPQSDHSLYSISSSSTTSLIRSNNNCNSTFVYNLSYHEFHTANHHAINTRAVGQLLSQMTPGSKTIPRSVESIRKLLYRGFVLQTFRSSPLLVKKGSSWWISSRNQNISLSKRFRWTIDHLAVISASELPHSLSSFQKWSIS